jgi:hypothetical protein
MVRVFPILLRLSAFCQDIFPSFQGPLLYFHTRHISLTDTPQANPIAATMMRPLGQGHHAYTSPIDDVLVGRTDDEDLTVLDVAATSKVAEKIQKTGQYAPTTHHYKVAGWAFRRLFAGKPAVSMDEAVIEDLVEMAAADEENGHMDRTVPVDMKTHPVLPHRCL